MVTHHLFFSAIRCLGLVIGRGMKTKPCRNKMLLDVKTHISCVDEVRKCFGSVMMSQVNDEGVG